MCEIPSQGRDGISRDFVNPRQSDVACRDHSPCFTLLSFGPASGDPTTPSDTTTVADSASRGCKRPQPTHTALLPTKSRDLNPLELYGYRIRFFGKALANAKLSMGGGRCCTTRAWSQEEKADTAQLASNMPCAPTLAAPRWTDQAVPSTHGLTGRCSHQPWLASEHLGLLHAATIANQIGIPKGQRFEARGAAQGCHS